MQHRFEARDSAKLVPVIHYKKHPVVPHFCGSGSIILSRAAEVRSWTAEIYHIHVTETTESYNVGHNLYADDTQLQNRMTLKDLDTIRSKMAQCVTGISDWCSSRRLQLNPENKEVIWFRSSINLDLKLKLIDTIFHFGSCDANPVKVVRDLGVFLDSELNTRANIGKVASVCFSTYATAPTTVFYQQTQRLVSAFVLSRIDYCNVALAELPDVTMSCHARVSTTSGWSGTTRPCYS